MKQAAVPAPKQIRCAIYTRKSTEDGLGMAFNSLDAQREAAEAYIKSQSGDGWVCLPDRFDDGGFTGANTDRPAFQRLMAAVEAGAVDCVVVYKIDRLSRSLADFARMMETFERHGVALVSVTQAFRTNDSMGRLTLNVLLSFAQFEREVIGERIRDKISAQRKRGMWCGGKVVLGYDVDRSGPSPRLVVNIEEAERVRAIFALYLELGSMMPVVVELRRRGWKTKGWRTVRTQKRMGGAPFDRASVHALLTNPIVTGKVTHKSAVHDGVHEAIVAPEIYAKVQARLGANARAKTSLLSTRSKNGALLRGLLRCKHCDSAMVHAMARRGNRAYTYYRCCAAARNGRASCRTGSLPGGEIDRYVCEQVREVLRRPEYVRATQNAVKKLVEAEGDAFDSTDLARLRTAAADIDSLWAVLTPSEVFAILHHLLERVDFDATTSTLDLGFRDGVLPASGRSRRKEVA